jgi:hypothetical protein
MMSLGDNFEWFSVIFGAFLCDIRVRRPIFCAKNGQKMSENGPL